MSNKKYYTLLLKSVSGKYPQTGDFITVSSALIKSKIAEVDPNIDQKMLMQDPTFVKPLIVSGLPYGKGHEAKVPLQVSEVKTDGSITAIVTIPGYQIDLAIDADNAEVVEIWLGSMQSRLKSEVTPDMTDYHEAIDLASSNDDPYVFDYEKRANTSMTNLFSMQCIEQYSQIFMYDKALSEDTEDDYASVSNELDEPEDDIPIDLQMLIGDRQEFLVDAVDIVKFMTTVTSIAGQTIENTMGFELSDSQIEQVSKKVNNILYSIDMSKQFRSLRYVKYMYNDND